MTIIIISGIIFLICFTTFAVLINENEGDHPMTALAFIIGTVSFFLYCINLYNYSKEMNQYRESIKVDLPKEIYEAAKGDTLYINKKTKDSIYLGFKSIKTE